MPTVAVNSCEFRQPVLVGDLIGCCAQVIRSGHTSLTMHVQVSAERDVDGPQCLKVTEANLTYVAVGPDRRPRLVARR